jgi:hypothetical protein
MCTYSLLGRCSLPTSPLVSQCEFKYIYYLASLGNVLRHMRREKEVRSNKDLVLSHRWVLYSKIDWPTDRQS